MSYNLLKNNIVNISGEVVSEPVYSHSVHNDVFYEFQIKVERLSNSFDILPVLVSEKLMIENDIKMGSLVSGGGQFRSYNKLEDGKSKLVLSVFLKDIWDYQECENPNSIEMIGYVCKEPIFRVTPFNREICDVLLAVNRGYNKSDYIPCIAWGKNARVVQNFEIGDKVYLNGRIQSREYQKKIGEEIVTRVAYEVSISKIDLIVEEIDVKSMQTSAGKLENYYVR